jgi:uncharacterized membrane protein
MTLFDWLALALFAGCWLFYEPILRGLSRRSGAIATDMTVVRGAWMQNMIRRDARLLDGQLLGHTINSGTFFASANLILIAAVAGGLFGGSSKLRSVLDLGLGATSARVVEIKLALITVTLTRGFLDFIWSIRQMNYCLAMIGAAPESGDPVRCRAFGEAVTAVLNPALSAFSQGVRGYYFALSAAAWLVGPLAFAVATLAGFALLVWRQAHSRSAAAVRRARALLEEASDG